VWENEVRTEIVTTGMSKVRSYDLDGKLLWELKGMTANTVPTPFAKDGLVYINSGYPSAPVRPVYAIRPGASGDISLKPGETSNQYIVWYQPLLGTYQTTSLAYGGYYTLLDRGFGATRLGAQIWRPPRISAGPVALPSPAGVEERFSLGRGRRPHAVRGSRHKPSHELAQ
jgi:hypothetical protein